jgi:hypothetical protein
MNADPEVKTLVPTFRLGLVAALQAQDTLDLTLKERNVRLGWQGGPPPSRETSVLWSGDRSLVEPWPASLYRLWPEKAGGIRTQELHIVSLASLGHTGES